jgi:hypothetical protein
MLTQGRSYRVASQLATQNRALIGMGSGRDGDDFVELVSTNARNIVIFPGGNFNDAKYYSEQFGEIDTVTIGESSSRSAMSPLAVGKLQPAKDTFQIKEDVEARMSPTDIILRPFGEITYSIVQKNTLQPAGIGLISYIDYDLNKKLDKMVEENNIMMSLGVDPNKFRDFNNQGAITDNLDWDAVVADYTRNQEKERAEAIGSDDELIFEEERSKYDTSAQKQTPTQREEPKSQPTEQTSVRIDNSAKPVMEDINTGNTGIKIDEIKPTPKKSRPVDDDVDDLI